MVVRMADGAEAALDYREKAPLAATRDMFLDEQGELTDKSLVGHLAAGVPGTVAGMWAAHQRFGTMPCADLVQPAVELAATLARIREHGSDGFCAGETANLLVAEMERGGVSGDA